ncbi:uncharacterized protein EDB93DRAFT_1120506 [Suillus bovinus]|uniref:uncharacterized protein n=1 Tax=Suillus bovinus TaxID=48563 RepID=UPI001B8619BD|nr:uncharacterized protein EDB93DRAFT_1120506 [Suillus bovinus]KAG2158229.1 hypothetical protein EDB93DRAFT_1120506 [Suillus bovinus]
MVVDGGCGNIVPRGSFAQTPTDMTPACFGFPTFLPSIMSSLSRVSSLIVVSVAAGLVPRGALAQASTATCISSDSWMNNSLQQNPCVVASYLQGVCVGGDFTVGPLSPGWFYGAPSGDGTTACACSTVTYSMLAACSVCQDTLYLSWSSWCSNCSMISIGLYPMDIPAGTKVPNWAYLNVTAGFDPIAALNNGGQDLGITSVSQEANSLTFCRLPGIYCNPCTIYYHYHSHLFVHFVCFVHHCVRLFD